MLLNQETFFTSEAASLLGLSTRMLGRWLDGYTVRGVAHPPVLRSEPRPRRDWRMVTWGEFIEAGHLAAFRWDRQRVPYKTLRWYVAQWNPKSASPYPLAQWDPNTDGARVPEVDRPSPEWEIRDYFARFDFEDGIACCYWPAGREVPVVVDPRRQCGRPTIHGTRITTSTLHGMNAAGDSVEWLADGYSLDVAQVEAAVEFERRLLLGMRLVA